MGKPKQFVKQTKKKGKKKNKGPETADDYLAVGVDFEEAGEKWRAGDNVKSTRFFIRAIENYDVALQKFPDSFDLAYNKARVQYEITQHPTLAAQIPVSLVDLLRIALESHRVALTMKQENADVLFNIAQVLTSLAEALSEGHKASQELKDEALRMLEEAVELFQRCLTLQEYQFSESQTQMDKGKEAEETALPIADEDTSMEYAASVTGSSSEAPEDDRWATIVEPVTQDTLLDTAMAQLVTLTTLCGLITVDSGSGLAWIEEYSTDLLQNKISKFAAGTGRQQEAALLRANFLCALADISFRTGNMNMQTYEQEIFVAFNNSELGDIRTKPDALTAKADAHLTFCSTLSESIFGHAFDAGTLGNLNILRWDHLSFALAGLTMASKLPSARNTAKIHLARGDVELLRFRLGQEPSNYGPAQKNAATLLQNAGVYYRGATAVARNTGIAEEEREGTVKEAVTKAIGGDSLALNGLLSQTHEVGEISEIFDEMVDDGLIDRAWAQTVRV